MEKNIAREKYINEILTDYISRKKEYDENIILQKLDKYYALKFKIENNDLLKDDVSDAISFYEKEKERKIELFKEGKSANEYNGIYKINYPENNNVLKNIQNKMLGNNYEYDYGNGYGNFYDNGIGYGYGYGNGNGYGNGYGYNQNMIYGGFYGYDMYDMYNPYGYNSGYGYNPYMNDMGMMGMSGMMQPGMNSQNNTSIFYKNALNTKDYGSSSEKYKRNLARIEEIQKNIDVKTNDLIGSPQNLKKDINDVIKKNNEEIEKIKEENEEIIKKIEDSLYETQLINIFDKSLNDLKITNEEQIEYEKLKIFFEKVLNYDKKNKNKCEDELFKCFYDYYIEAKKFIEKELTKYNIIISTYIELIELPGYEYDSEDFINRMTYIKKKILESVQLYNQEGGTDKETSNNKLLLNKNDNEYMQNIENTSKLLNLYENFKKEYNAIEYKKNFDNYKKIFEINNISKLKEHINEIDFEQLYFRILKKTLENADDNNNKLIKFIGDENTTKKIFSNNENTLKELKQYNDNIISLKSVIDDFETILNKDINAINIKTLIKNYEENTDSKKNTKDINHFLNKLKFNKSLINKFISNFDKIKKNNDNIILILDASVKKADEGIKKIIERRNLNSGQQSESLYKKVWDKYIKDLDDPDKYIDETRNMFFKQYIKNNLDPKKELKLTTDDKLLFILIMFIIRQIILSILNKFIDKDIVITLYYSLVVYVVLYILFISIIVIIVNIDDYKLRIIFNYFNMHVNSRGLLLHVVMLSIGTYLLYILLQNMSKNLDIYQKKTISEVEKLQLIYKIELATLAIFVGTVCCDFFVS